MQRITVTETGRATLTGMWPDDAAAIQRHVGAKFHDEEEARQLYRLTGRILGRP